MTLRYIATGQDWHPSERIDGVLYPPNIEGAWSDDLLASIGLERVPPPPPPDPLPPPGPFVPTSITRRQCALELEVRGLATLDEAVAMATVATPPAIVSGYLAALTETERKRALIDFAAANYYRDNPVLAAILAAAGASPADGDAFFISAAAR